MARTMAAAASAAAAGARTSRSRRRRLGSGAGSSSFSTRDSKPTGASRCGASSRSSSASVRELLHLGAALRALGEMLKRAAALLALDDAEGQLDGDLASLLAARVHHSNTSSSDRSLSIAVRIRVFTVPSGHAVEVADLPRRATHVGGEHQGAALVVGQVGDRRAELVALVGLEARLVRAGDLVLDRDLRGDHLRIDGIEALHPGHVDRQVASDREQPGGDPALAGVVVARVPVDAREGLLGDLLRDRGLADDRQGESEDPPLKAAHEGGRRARVTGRKAGEQCLVGGIHIHSYGAPRGIGLSAVLRSWASRGRVVRARRGRHTKHPR